MCSRKSVGGAVASPLYTAVAVEKFLQYSLLWYNTQRQVKQMTRTQKQYYVNIKDNPRHQGEAYEKLYIQQKVYDLGVYLWPVLAKVNREHRFILVQTTMHDFNKMRELIVIANKKYTKKSTLQELDVAVASFKADIAWLHEVGELKDKQFEIILKNTVEIGQMVGGWIKAEKAHGGVPDDGREYTCVECNAVINGKIYDYSTKHYGKALCYACQKKCQKLQ